MMTPQQAFAAMGELMPLIKRRYNRETVLIDVDTQLTIKTLWEQFLFPGAHLNSAGCAPCIEHAMDVIYSYYEREYPRFLSTLIPAEPIAAVESLTDPTDQSQQEETKTIPATTKKKMNGRK